MENDASSQGQASSEELRRARLIKDKAIQNGLDIVSDFEYLQHAIVAKEDLGKALKRIQRLQNFRKQYKITTIENDRPLELFEKWNTEYSPMITGIGLNPDGRPSLLADYKSFNPKILKTEDDWILMMKVFYYVFIAMQSDLRCIRNGIDFIADCEGISWENFSFEVEKRAADLYQGSYPVRINSNVMLDAPKIVSFHEFPFIQDKIELT